MWQLTADTALCKEIVVMTYSHHRPLLLALASAGMIALIPQAYAQGDNGETAG
jgi:hypothetical protein